MKREYRVLSACWLKFAIIPWIFFHLSLSSLAWAGASQDDFTFDYRNWNLETEKSRSLDGQWKFFPGTFVLPQDVFEAYRTDSLTRDVPSQWGIADMQIDGVQRGFGYASYISKLILKGHKRLYLYTIGPQSSGKLWVIRKDGKVLFQGDRGTPGRTATDTTAVNFPPIEGIVDTGEPGEHELYILVHVSNFHYAKGGFRDSLILFEEQTGRVRRSLEQFMWPMVFGVLIVVGLYHLILFAQRKQDALPAYFAGFCLTMALRQLVMSGLFDALNIAQTTFAFQVLATLEFMTMPLLGYFASFFIQGLVPGEFFLRVVTWLKWFALGLIVMTLILPLVEFSAYLWIYQLYLVVGIVLILVHLIAASLKGVPFAKLTLFTFFIVAAFGVNDILHARGAITTGFVVPYALIGFVLTQAGLIARKFAQAFEERDASQNALLETYRQLDDELLRREKLLQVNSELQEENQLASQQLIEADKLATLGTMVAGIAHDIANPTGLISANQERAVASLKSSEELLDSCFRDVEDDETQAVYRSFQSYHADVKTALGRVELGTERIAAINTAIRNQARRDQSIESVLLRPVIDECLVIVGNRLKGIDVEVDVSDVLSVEMVRSQFGQVLMNLVANAADAISDFESDAQQSSVARIKISASQPGNSFYLMIEDSGPGIPEGLREKILEPFFTTKSLGKGTGLGMPIVLKILDTHKMTLSIDDSEQLGGASFIIQEV